ncbi:MAG: MCP four helix bundle domain-containing protein [candidate division NC10 bacterium]|nr:MCP four helix bundle domain-containing protein [candidate division NC10 bacterium]
MKWTVGQRITVGYAVILVLLMVVAGVGYIALSRTAETFETVIHAQERDLGAVRRGDSAIDRATDIFLRYLLVPDESLLKDVDEANAEVRRVMTELRDQAGTAELKTGWGEPLNLLNAWEGAIRSSMAAQRAGRHADALRIRTERVLPVRQQRDTLVAHLVELQGARTREVVRSAVTGASQALWAMLIVSGLALASGVVITWGLTRSITRPLRQTIGTLASACSEILAATTQQASGTAEEATAVQETSTTVDEVKQTAQVSAQKARAVTEGVQQIAQVSQEGRRAVEESIKGMHETKGRMETIAERILTLSEQGQAIGEIITAVNDLAEQSNLLAVNAAI